MVLASNALYRVFRKEGRVDRFSEVVTIILGGVIASNAICVVLSPQSLSVPRISSHAIGGEGGEQISLADNG